MSEITVADLAGVVYSSGKVFEGLKSGRLDTENFLRSGNLQGVSSRADLALLEDLRDVAQFIIDHRGEAIDAAYVRAVNARMTRSAALHPGKFRTSGQGIGVETRYGRHSPPAITAEGLQRILDSTLARGNVRESALDVFVELAKAQPFEDGNKRTALFVANGMLLGSANAGQILTVPFDENDPGLSSSFNDSLARAYLHDQHDDVKAMLRNHGLTRLAVRQTKVSSRSKTQA